MVTGDREENAQTVGAVIGVDDVFAERTPAEKVEAVRLEKRAGNTIMVGDGINDAPALALADVGVAVGARGATASSEAADVVLTVDRLDRLGEALVIARRSRRIALESVVVGMGLSLGAMVVAAFGYLPPVWGALLQELIDVAVILNALRALRDTTSANRLSGEEAALARRFSAEHRTLRPDLARIRDVADHLDVGRPAESIARLRDVQRFLVEELDPHEQAEDHDLYPVLARVLGGNDPTATMSRAHVEIGAPHPPHQQRPRRTRPRRTRQRRHHRAAPAPLRPPCDPAAPLRPRRRGLPLARRRRRRARAKHPVKVWYAVTTARRHLRITFTNRSSNPDTGDYSEPTTPCAAGRCRAQDPCRPSTSADLIDSVGLA